MSLPLVLARPLPQPDAPIFAREFIQKHGRIETLDATREQLIERKLYSVPKLWSLSKRALQQVWGQEAQQVLFQARIKFPASPLVVLDCRSKKNRDQYEAWAEEKIPWHQPTTLTCAYFRPLRKEYNPNLPLNFPYIQGVWLTSDLIYLCRPELDVGLQGFKILGTGYNREWLERHVLSRLKKRGYSKLLLLS